MRGWNAARARILVRCASTRDVLSRYTRFLVTLCYQSCFFFWFLASHIYAFRCVYAKQRITYSWIDNMPRCVRNSVFGWDVSLADFFNFIVYIWLALLIHYVFWCGCVYVCLRLYIYIYLNMALFYWWKGGDLYSGDYILCVSFLVWLTDVYIRAITSLFKHTRDNNWRRSFQTPTQSYCSNVFVYGRLK